MSSAESLSGPAPECEGQRRRRTKYNKNQYKVLLEAFQSDAYPDINVRMALAKRLKIPEPRIQVWFQNRRARDRLKKAKKKKACPLVPEPIHGRVGAAAPRPSHGGVCAPSRPCQQCLLAAQRHASLFSSKPGNASGQAGFGGCVGNLGMNMASRHPPTAAAEPSGDPRYSSSSSFSLPSFSSGFSPTVPTASPQSSPQPGAGRAETYVAGPEQLLAGGNEAPQGYGQGPPSEQQPWWSWQPWPALKPEMEFAQPAPQSLEAAVPPWSCGPLPPTPASSPPQPPLPQERCSHHAPRPSPMKAPAHISSRFHPYL